MKRLLPLLLVPLAAFAVDYPTVGSIERLDPALDAILPKDARMEKLCEGFNWSEGPVWKDGSLLFSDVPENIIYQWKPGTTAATVFLKPSGMTTPKPTQKRPGAIAAVTIPAAPLAPCGCPIIDLVDDPGTRSASAPRSVRTQRDSVASLRTVDVP